MMKRKYFIKTTERASGYAIIVVSLLILFLTLSGVAFMKRSTLFTAMTGMASDSINAHYQMETAYQAARAKVSRAVDHIALTGKLPVVHGGLLDETYTNVNNAYPVGSELTFLQEAVRTQALNANNQIINGHEFAGQWEDIFPSSWRDPNLNDNQYYEVKYTFTPLDKVSTLTPRAQILFQYEYNVKVRAYGQNKFTSAASEDSGVIEIRLEYAPFSQWSLFRSQTQSPSGSNLYFAGGDSSSQIQETFRGPVHTNQTPNFMGHPNFLPVGSFTSAVPYASWNMTTQSGYGGTPNFAGGTASGAGYLTTMPTDIFNTSRLAAGDTNPDAATNNTPVTNANLVTWLTQYAGGTIPGGTPSVPTGIYIPIDNQTSKTPTGGIYVQGDAKIVMNVVQGSSTIPSNQWSNIQMGDRACKFQKISVTSLTGGVLPRDIYIGDDPCNTTYYFDGTSGSTAAPVVLNGRVNGNIHVVGNIDELGGASRTRPAIAKDFAFTVSATKDVRIKNDLQYEDAAYVSMDSAGTLGSAVVADPYNTIGDPQNQNLAATISSSSQTILGIISINNSVRIHENAPANINIHGAIYAGNDNAESGGFGCGSSSHPGCGFGVENYANLTGRGSVKLLGSISEYRSQGVGVVSTSAGYSRRYNYDQRLFQSLMPPAFPISDRLQAYPKIIPIKTWRLSQGN
jgi:hypothetical protein